MMDDLTRTSRNGRESMNTYEIGFECKYVIQADNERYAIEDAKEALMCALAEEYLENLFDIEIKKVY